MKRAWRAAWLVVALAAACARGDEAFAPLRMRVAGSPRQIGLQVGQAHKDFIRRQPDFFAGLGMLASGTSREALTAQAGRLAEHLAPEDAEEVRGVAEGAGISHEDALLLNLFFEVAHQSVFCRQLAVWGKASADGEMIHGRNLDWFDYPGQVLQKNNLILNVKPAKGVEYMVLTWPGFQAALTGVNRAGLSIAYNQVLGAPPRGSLSEPVLFSLKRALRSARTLDEAVDLFVKARPFGSGTILIADSPGRKAAVVEVVGGRVGVRTAEEMIGNANHATKEAGVAAWGVEPASWPVCDAARSLGLPLDRRKMIEVLRDRRVLQPNNLLSVVFEPAKNRMWLSCGRLEAARGRFVEYGLWEQGLGQRPEGISGAGARLALTGAGDGG